MDLKLDKSTGDLDISGNEIKLNSGLESIEQDWRVRLQTFRGEWFLDTRIGIPYFESVLVKNPINAVLRSIFHSASLETPGIKEIAAFYMNLDAPNRRLELQIEGESEDLETFVFTYSEMILAQPGAEI